MKFEEISSKQTQYFSQFTLVFCLLLGWLGIILALMGVFFGVIIKIYLAGALLLGGLTLVKNLKKDFWKSEFFLVSIIALSATIIFLSWSAPTIFSGRDQGALSEAAIRLAENHRLNFSSPVSEELYKIYGPGKALNFPGFNYNFDGQLITQFSPGYISWLASFFSIFGLTGFSVANGLTFFIFLISFYLVARKFLPLGPALATLLLILTAFIFPWFLKFTLSENLAWALFWFGLLQLLNFWQKPCLPPACPVDRAGKAEKSSFVYLILTGGLFIFSRPEAWVFTLIILLLLIFKFKNNQEWLRLINDKKIWSLALAILVVFTGSVWVNPQGFLEIFKGAAKPLLFFQQEISSASAFSLFFYMLAILKTYFLLGFLIFAAGEIFILIWRKKIEMLLPFLVGLPTFFYLIQPGITLDHPWMLRRLAFAVVPLIILYTVLFLHDLLKKHLFFYGILTLLLVGNIWITTHFLTFVPDKNLLKQTADLSQNFAKEDLIFVDQKASGNGWSMLTGPLNFVFGKQAIYLFNPKDVTKIDLDKFSDIYFIIPESQLSFYEENGLAGKLKYVKDYQLQNTVLEENLADKNHVSNIEVALPEVKEIIIKGGIYKLEK